MRWLARALAPLLILGSCVLATPASALVGFTVQANVTGTAVELTWTDAGNESSYIVHRSVVNAGSWVKLVNLGANVLTWTHDPADAGTWDYRVTAKNSKSTKRVIVQDVVVGAEPPPPPPPPPPVCEGVDVTGDIQEAIDANPAGTTFCLSGEYAPSAALSPKDGQSFIGPAFINGRNLVDSGFELKLAGAEDVSLVDLEIANFTLRAVECWTGTQALGGRYHDNGRNGFGCGLESLGGVLVDGVEIDSNGSVEELGAGAGGVKFARAHGVVVQNSYIHDNLGNGVWCDVQCGDYTVIDNVIARNSRKGVHYEKSGESDEIVSYVGFAYIARNVIQNNGWEGREHAADAGVALVSSKNVLIEDNIFGGNHREAVIVRQDGRLDGEKHGWVISNVTIRDNTLNGDGIIGCDLGGVTCTTFQS